MTFIPLIFAWILSEVTVFKLLCFSSSIQKWQNAELNGKFKLPMKNEFIPTNFEILPLEKEATSCPSLIKVTC